MRVRVDIDVDELLNELSSDELLDHIGDRRLKTWIEARGLRTDVFRDRETLVSELFVELRRAVVARDFDELLAIMDSYERPKWRSPEACEKDFLKLKGLQ